MNKKKKRVCYQVETVRGTQQLHAFMSVKKGVLNTKIYSDSPNYTENCVISVLKDTIELEDIRVFVTCMCGNFWWLGCVLSVSEESNNVKTSFLHPHGPSASYIHTSSYATYSAAFSVSNSSKS
jgi:hypothetical protein